MRLSASLGPLTDRDDRFPFPLYTSSSKSQFLLKKAIPSDDSFRHRLYREYPRVMSAQGSTSLI